MISVLISLSLLTTISLLGLADLLNLESRRLFSLLVAVTFAGEATLDGAEGAEDAPSGFLQTIHVDDHTF